MWAKNNRLAAIVAERGLSIKGFRRSLRALVKEFHPDESVQESYYRDDPLEPDETPIPSEEIRADIFEEWFGYCNVVPAAYRLRREGRSIWDITVEVYEVENHAEVPEHKLGCYGNMADGEGPHFELHIIDRYDHEIVVKSEDLMRFMCLSLWSDAEKREELKWLRSQAVAQHHAPVVVELGVDVLQDVIYGLGLGQTHKVIAQRTGLSVEMVKATASLLTANSVNPKDIVKDTHARWKAAYDAVRELGVKL